MLLARVLIAGAILLLTPSLTFAERMSTRDAFERLEEVLELRQEDGQLDPRDVVPVILVSARPMFEASQGWHPARALTLLTQAFGGGGVRSCEACMRPRTVVEGGRLTQTSGPVSLDEIIALDDRYRGVSARAKSAAWIDETVTGVAIRIVDLSTGRIVFAQNIDPMRSEYTGSARRFRLSAELERRTRGDSLTHAFFDMALYPGQHLSLEWDDQWGETNANLSGVVLSLYDPVLGIGASYSRAIEWYNLLVGVQAVLSVPTIIAQSQTDEDAEIIDPVLTGVFVLRIPFGGSNYGALLTASTNGEVGIGLSLLNTSLIPVLP